jgi:integrase
VLGLAFMVTDKGARSFYLYRKVHGRPQRIRIGGFPDISVEQARKMAVEINAQIVQGKDPAAERKAIRTSITLQDLYDRYDDEYAKPRSTEKTRVTDKSRFNTCFDEWKTRKLTSIRSPDVRSLHAKLGKDRGHTTANRAVQLLRRLFYWAKLTPNPAGKAEVDLFSETERDRFLQPDELPRFYQAVQAELNETVRDAIMMSLLCGARRSNVQAMRWCDVSLDRATWTIPSDQSKNRKPMTIHLPTQAISVLMERQDNDSEFVFPGRGKSGHLEETKTAWQRILKAADIKDLRFHDLRRSLGSWMAASGASLPIVGKQLGHVDPSATKIYARLNIDPVKPFVDAAATAMFKAAHKKQQVKTKKAGG